MKKSRNEKLQKKSFLKRNPINKEKKEGKEKRGLEDVLFQLNLFDGGG